jgi:hypothetical protein
MSYAASANALILFPSQNEDQRPRITETKVVLRIIDEQARQPLGYPKRQRVSAGIDSTSTSTVHL